MCDKNGISAGEGGLFCELILENPEGRVVISKIPSVGEGGGEGYGYFLELHNASSLHCFYYGIGYSSSYELS